MAKRIFRLKFRREPVSIPGQYVLIDEALQMTGETLYPDSWGHTSGYAALPFNAQYKRKVITETPNGWVEDWTEVNLEALSAGEASRLWKNFSSARRALIEAAEAGHVRFYPISKTSGVGPQLSHGVPTMQRDLITHTGTVFLGEAHSEPATVIVLEKDLHKWISSGGPGKIFEEDKDPRPATAIGMRQVRYFLDYINAHDLKVTKDWAFRVLRAAAGKSISGNSLMNDFWEATAKYPMPNSRKLPGRSSTAHNQSMEAHYERAVAAVRDGNLKASSQKSGTKESS